MPTGPELPLLHSAPEIGPEREGRCPSHASAERRLPRWLKRRAPNGNANHSTAPLLDDLHEQCLATLVMRLATEADVHSHATHLLWIVHNLERVGDHATNVAERVVFLVSGETPELN